MADIAVIIDLVNQYQVGKIVVGLPVTLAGEIGSQAKKVVIFVQKLKLSIEVPVEFKDERLTTTLAKRLMGTRKTKKKRQKAKDDAVAAALILQSYLDEE